MAKSRGGLVTILLFLGALFTVSGLIFTLQGLGIVGRVPVSCSRALPGSMKVASF